MAKDALEDLLLFYSAKQGKLITFAEYVAAAKEAGVGKSGGDDDSELDAAHTIYFAAGDSIPRLAKSPTVTTVLAKGYDVLLCDSDVDEFCMLAFDGYDVEDEDSTGDDQLYTAWPVKNVGSEDLGLTTEAEKKEAEEQTEAASDLFEAMKEALGDKVEKVIVSTRLTDAPVVLTTEGAVSLKMSHVLRHQATASEHLPELHVVMEVNAKHPVFETLKAAHEAGDAEKVAEFTGILYDQAMLVEGLPIEDPIAFAQAITKLMH
jgi:molecular chaperone HtpG